MSSIMSCFVKYSPPISVFFRIRGDSPTVVGRDEGWGKEKSSAKASYGQRIRGTIIDGPSIHHLEMVKVKMMGKEGGK